MYTTEPQLVLQIPLPSHMTAAEFAQLRKEAALFVRRFIARREDVELSSHGWDVKAARILIARLMAGGHRAQVDVILALAKNGGAIDRAGVYEATKYPEERSLRGFTRPVRRIMEEMVESEALGKDAVVPLDPLYDELNRSFQQAQGFAMPEPLAEVFAEVERQPIRWQQKNGEWAMRLKRTKKKAPAETI